MDKLELKSRILFKRARRKMTFGFAYSIEDLCPVDSMADEEVLAVMDLLDRHPLIRRDSEFPKTWRLL